MRRTTVRTFEGHRGANAGRLGNLQFNVRTSYVSTRIGQFSQSIRALAAGNQNLNGSDPAQCDALDGAGRRSMSVCGGNHQNLTRAWNTRGGLGAGQNSL